MIGAIESIRDITGRKQAETDLQRAYDEIAASEEGFQAQFDAIREHDAMIRASEEKFRETTNNIPGVVFRFKANPDGSLTLPYVSDRVRDILGIEDTRGDLFKTLTSHIHPDDRAAFFVSIDEAVRSRSPWRAEARLFHQTFRRDDMAPGCRALWNTTRVLFLPGCLSIYLNRRGEKRHDVVQNRNYL